MRASADAIDVAHAGRGIARAFLREGAFVFVNGRSEASVRTLSEEFDKSGFAGRYHAIVCDLATAEGCETFFTAVDRTGREVDVLINNVGIFTVQDFFQVDDAGWMRFHETNLMSSVRFARRFLEPMLKRGRGRVVMVSSECGLRPIPAMIPYRCTAAPGGALCAESLALMAAALMSVFRKLRKSRSRAAWPS
jgi:NAD(P)-dependent dehydrogenase (short-subunit alcohol dehydrogenase family)